MCAANAVFVTFVHNEKCVGAHVEMLIAFDSIFGRYDWAEIVVWIGNKVDFFTVEEFFLWRQWIFVAARSPIGV